jgi:predicted MFS family arabinose efflux permease
MLNLGGCGILLLTKLGGYLFDRWTAGAPFYIMAILNIIALFAAIIVMFIDRAKQKPELINDDENEPLLSTSNDA